MIHSSKTYHPFINTEESYQTVQKLLQQNKMILNEEDTSKTKKSLIYQEAANQFKNRCAANSLFLLDK